MLHKGKPNRRTEIYAYCNALRPVQAAFKKNAACPFDIKIVSATVFHIEALAALYSKELEWTRSLYYDKITKT
jgi:hypothetical protein